MTSPFAAHEFSCKRERAGFYVQQVNSRQGGSLTALSPAPQHFSFWDADREILAWDLLL